MNIRLLSYFLDSINQLGLNRKTNNSMAFLDFILLHWLDVAMYPTTFSFSFFKGILKSNKFSDRQVIMTLSSKLI